MPNLSPYAIYAKIAAAIAVVVFVAWGSHWTTKTYYQLQISKDKEIQAQAIIIAQDEAAEKQAEADRINMQLAIDAANDRADRLARQLANARKVADYVTPETDRKFPLPCGFVRMHDAYARDLAPEAVSLPPGKLDTDKCDVAASAAVRIIGDNYGTALGWRGDLVTWDRWYVEQAANWNAKPAVEKPAEQTFFQRINPFR